MPAQPPAPPAVPEQPAAANAVPRPPRPPQIVYGTADTTLREIVHVSIGGPGALRVIFTNEFGTEPLTIGAAHVAISQGGSRYPGISPLSFRTDTHRACDHHHLPVFGFVRDLPSDHPLIQKRIPEAR